MSDETFSDRVQRFRDEAPERAARTANESAIRRWSSFIGALLALLLIVLVAGGLLVVVVWSLLDWEVWKPIVGFLIFAVVLAGISYGVQQERSRRG